MQPDFKTKDDGTGEVCSTNGPTGIWGKNSCRENNSW